MNRSRWWWFVASVALTAGGCAGRVYELQPVPRAGDGAPPVKAQVRRLSWLGQPESGDLAAGAIVRVEVDLYDADPSRPFVVGRPRMEARPALGGPAVGFAPADEDGAFSPSGDPSGEGYAASGARPGETVLRPHEGRTVEVAFEVPQGDPPRGPQRLVVVVPVRGQPNLEIAVADPVPGGPVWPAGRVAGLYVFSGLASVDRASLEAFEPLGLAVRLSRGRWVLGLGTSYTFLYQEALAGGPPAQGISLHAQLTWQPWFLHYAPYVELASFTGRQAPPAAYATSARTLELPRVSLGVLIALGERLGATGALPFEHVLSPQRVFGLRLGYTRWFNVGERGGAGGFELSLERGFGP